jgi:hypothetical protein
LGPASCSFSSGSRLRSARRRCRPAEKTQNREAASLCRSCRLMSIADSGRGVGWLGATIFSERTGRAHPTGFRAKACRASSGLLIFRIIEPSLNKTWMPDEGLHAHLELRSYHASLPVPGSRANRKMGRRAHLDGDCPSRRCAWVRERRLPISGLNARSGGLGRPLPTSPFRDPLSGRSPRWRLTSKWAARSDAEPRLCLRPL